MKTEERILRGLLAFGGAVLSRWAINEAGKALDKNWRENNYAGVFVSAGAMTVACGGYFASMKELHRVLNTPTKNLRLTRKTRPNPLFHPENKEYPA